MFEKFDNSLKPSFLEFMNGKLARVLDEGRSIRQLYLNNMYMFKYDQRDKKK